MNFRAEPAYRHGQPAPRCWSRWAPGRPTRRRCAAGGIPEREVVEIPRLLWWPILHGIILRRGRRAVRSKYASIWTPEVAADGVDRAPGPGARRAAGRRRPQVLVRHAMPLRQPGIPAVLDALRAEASRVLVLPMYPRYAAPPPPASPTGCCCNGRRRRAACRVALRRRAPTTPATSARWPTGCRRTGASSRGERLILSFHGVPERSLTLGDPYHCQCHKTARLLAERLGLPPEAVTVTFQSRFGKAKWLEPYTEPTLKALAAQGVKSVDVMCPGFVADCLETLEEIAQEARDAFIEAGGRTFHYVPCLNTEPAWIDALAALAERHLQGWPTGEVADAADLARQRERALAMGARD
ncbi:MAG: ferrochelatase [Rubrivivax sp.]|nr:ferrochelatase [Rubrivivax sp.]